MGPRAFAEAMRDPANRPMLDKLQELNGLLQQGQSQPIELAEASREQILAFLRQISGPYTKQDAETQQDIEDCPFRGLWWVMAVPKSEWVVDAGKSIFFNL